MAAPSTAPRVSIVLALVMLVAIAGLAAPSAPATAAPQDDARDPARSIPITGDRLSGTVLPVEPLSGDISITALRGWAWTVDDTKRLVLRGDVTIRIADYLLSAREAVIWINRIPSADGVINQIAMYFDEVGNPTRRAGLGIGGTDLLVTASSRGAVRLKATLLEAETPRGTGIQRRAERRLREHLRRIHGPGTALADRPQVDRPPPPDEFTPIPGGVVKPADIALPTRIDLPESDQTRPWLSQPDSFIRFSYGAVEITPGTEENVITVSDSVVVEYHGRGDNEDIDQLTLSADRAVIFTDPGPLEEMTRWELDAALIRGIYLEGNVSASANNGEYLVRAPRVYYDFTTDQAIMLDSVLRTYDRQLNVPIYARAKEMRQVARDQWTASEVRVTTSEFYTGHLALGARQLTISQPPPGSGDAGSSPASRTRIDARDITLRAQDVPFFWWPSFAGTVRDIPLRRVDVGTRDNDGVRIRTAWDLFSLTGGDRPDGVDAELRVDGFTKRGAALGLGVEYDVALGYGEVDLYGLWDDGTDRTSSGREVVYEEEFRGNALWEHELRLGSEWTLQAQASYISDPTFMTAWRESDFRERREYETSVYLKHQKDRAALTVLGSYELNDFISNDYLLASAQYQVDRQPSVSYRRYGDTLFDTFTYSTETRVDRMRFVFEESTPRQLGVRGRAFGLGEDDPIEDALRAGGLSSRYVNRFDTRHELAMPFDAGIFRFSPFVVGRFTAYDDDFEEFSGEDDQARMFGAAGVRVHTQFQRVDNTVDSRLFDVHRLRHILEPSAAVWYGYADVTEEDLPIYDPDVESLGTGATARVGLRSIWQTQRGGPGRWRSVDFLTVNADLILTSGDTNRESPAPQFFDYRPEYSQFGDHVRGSIVWLLSDTLAIVGESTIDIDDSRVARGSIGAELRHTPLFSTYVEFRYIEASDNELLGIGWSYRLSPKYRVVLTPQWDFRVNEFRSVDLRVTRSFPDFDLVFRVRHDDIRDDTSFSAALQLTEF